MASPTSPRPAASNTEPAGSRESKAQGIHPAALRKYTRELREAAAEVGIEMTRREVFDEIVRWTALAEDQGADGWNAWLRHRFNPTEAAALANIKRGA